MRTRQGAQLGGSAWGSRWVVPGFPERREEDVPLHVTYAVDVAVRRQCGFDLCSIAARVLLRNSLGSRRQG